MAHINSALFVDCHLDTSKYPTYLHFSVVVKALGLNRQPLLSVNSS